jgi:hypothetical protein
MSSPKWTVSPESSCRCLEQGNGFDLGGGGFAQVKLHVLTGTHPLSNGHGAIVEIDSDQVADQEGTRF